MTGNRRGHSAAFSILLATPLIWPALAGAYQAMPGAMTLAAVDASAEKTGIPDGMVFAEGTRAINEGRWTDAVAIFSKIAENKSDHADGALYWKAYAEDKLGHSAAALDSCAALLADYPKSSWLEDCGALQIEIHSKSGHVVLPTPQDSDDLKLLALNSMMQHDEAQARVQIQDILDDEDASDRLKNGALFLLGQHRSTLSFPQIVRISYLEGDVRVERSKQNEKGGATGWEKAEIDTPIESGYNLVTGAGRAEIEFENASTIYLDENSVLTFNDLHTTDNVPYTEVALLSGTVTLDVKPYVAGEVFLLKTPTDDNLITTYPHVTYMRVTSYVDATAFTPQEGGVLRLPGANQQTNVGQTLYFRTEHRLDTTGIATPQSFGDWDKWVSARVAARTKATAEAMQAAGLTTPLPGLAEMEGQGKFFDCPPFGMCWEPTAAEEWEQRNGGESGAEPMADAVRPQSTPAAVESAQLLAQPAPHANPATGAPGGVRRLEDYDFFPCLPDQGLYRWTMDTPGQQGPLAGSRFPYRWTVCHSGYWIRHRRHYVWVVGKRHHHPPVHWVKSGKMVAFVPIHPKDVKGEPPVNGKDRLFPINLKTGIAEGPIKLPPEHPITVMKEPPKEFRGAEIPTLARADEPHVFGHSFKEETVGKTGERTAPGIPIAFDHKTGNFTMPQHVMQGGREVTVNAPISNHNGNLQSHAVGTGGTGGGVHGGGNGGGSSGGGAHSGGGSSGGSSSGSASASSGGGSHH